MDGVALCVSCLPRQNDTCAWECTEGLAERSQGHNEKAATSLCETPALGCPGMPPLPFDAVELKYLLEESLHWGHQWRSVSITSQKGANADIVTVPTDV